MELSMFNLQFLSAGALLILAALAMIVGGSVLVSRASRMRRELVGHRVGMVTSPSPGAPTNGAGDAVGEGSALMRNPKETALRREVVRRFTKLGISADRTQLAFVGLQLTTALGLGFLAFAGGSYVTGRPITALPVILMTTTMGIVGWFIPSFFLKRSIKARTKQVAAALPEALELLVICAEAGLGFSDGIDRIVRELRESQPALSEELGLTAADLRILPSRDQALANFAERVDVPGVRSLVTTLGQTMRYGTPLAQAMRVVAAEMRNEALIHLEERANRLPALLTVPMMLFIMPTIFLVVGGPAALKLMDVFSH